MANEDYYATLGVSKTATDEEIKEYRQYRLLFDREEDEDSHERKVSE